LTDNITYEANLTMTPTSGTIRGAVSGARTLNGNGYQGFNLQGSLYFMGNIDFNNFHSYVDNGGVIHAIGSNITFNTQKVNFSNNSSVGSDIDGGAIYAEYSTITFGGGEVNFLNNDGYAITARNSIITIKADSGNVLFEGNYGIRLRSSELNLFADNGRKIEFKGGITADGYNMGITKSGMGDVIFAGRLESFGIDLIIEAGTIRVLSLTTFPNGNLTIKSGAKLSFVDTNDNEFHAHYVQIASATISGTLEINLNLNLLNSTAAFKYFEVITFAGLNLNGLVIDIIQGSTFTFMPGSFLNIRTFGDYPKESKSVPLIYKTRGEIIDGVEYWNNRGLTINNLQNIDYDRSHYRLREGQYSETGIYDGSPYIAYYDVLWLDILGFRFLDKFLVNSLSLSAKSYGIDDIYNRLSAGIGQKGSAWVGFYGSGESIDDFSVNGFGATAGVDLYKNQNLLGGLFVRYGYNNMKEEDEKGAMSEMEVGLYGGFFEIKNSPINIKANLSMGFQNYTIETADDLSFDSKSIKGGFEAEYVMPLTPTIKIKPFLGFQSGMAMNDDIKIDDYSIIKSDNLLRVETKIGIGLSGNLGANKNFNWFGRLYGIFLVSGAEPKYTIKESE
jgi:predicted outer membrane repeat protein